jgi:hypothetical protein
MTLNRYATALLSFAVTIVGALVLIPADGFDLAAGIGLAVLAITTGAQLGLPLAPTRWQGLFKTGAVAVAAVLQALVPLLTGGVFNHVTIGLLVLTGLQAIAGEIGIQVRQTAALIDARDSNVITSLPVTATPPEIVTQEDLAVAAADTPALASAPTPSPV